MTKKKDMADNYVKYKYKDRTPKELSKKTKIILGGILVILIVSTGFLGYELKTTTMIKENAIAYQEYNPDFDYEHEEIEEKSGWGSITAEKLEPYREITSNIQKQKEEKQKSNEQSNSNSNEEDKGKAPVISKVSLSVNGSTIVATAKYLDDDSDSKKISVVYSINAGKTWQKSNTFTNLKLNTTYTVTVKVTDDKGNSTTSQAKIKTPAAAKARANVTGIFKNGGSYIQVYQINTNTIVYSIGKATTKSTHRATLTNNSNGIKAFTGGLKFDSANLTYNGKTYIYSGKVDTDEMFKEYYGGYLDPTSVFNGSYKNIKNGSYTLDIVPIRNGMTQSIYVYVSGGGKSTVFKLNINTSKISYSASGETFNAAFYRGNLRVESSSSKGTVLATASGDYARYSKFTMESAVKNKLGL